MSKDEYDGIFDAVSVGDFERDTSAVLQSYTAPPTFDEFTQRHLDAARIAFAASDGRLNPVAWLTRIGNAEIAEQVFVPDDDDTVGSFISRLAREARAHGSTALFYVMRTQGSVVFVTEATEDEAVVDEAQAGMSDVLFWYAEHADARQMGFIKVVNQTRLGEEIVTPGTQHASLLESVLGNITQSE